MGELSLDATDGHGPNQHLPTITAAYLLLMGKLWRHLLQRQLKVTREFAFITNCCCHKFTFVGPGHHHPMPVETLYSSTITGFC